MMTKLSKAAREYIVLDDEDKKIDKCLKEFKRMTTGLFKHTKKQGHILNYVQHRERFCKKTY